MSERFIKLYELQKNLYSEGSPIIVSAGSLLKDTQTSNIIVQLKFHSVSATTIKALKVGITAFDIAGKEIDGISEYQYLDLSIQNGQDFGSNKAIVMPNSVTRSFSIKSIIVVLADGHIIDITLPLSSLPHPVAIQSALIDAELVKQYRLKTKTDAVYVPQESLGIWQCHCGEWNSCTNCSRCRGHKSAIFAALDLPSLTNEMNSRLAEEAKRRAEIERQQIEREREKAEQARIQAEKKAKRNAALKKGVKRTLIVIGAIVAVCVALVIAGIIFLFATDKPIDDDFSQSYEDSLHSLTYRVPENWEYSADESSEKEKLYARYDNWGNLLGLMSVLYEGDSPDTLRQNVVSEFENASKSSKTQTKTIGNQSFDIVTFTLDSNDGTPLFCNVYITEQNQSVFYIVFSFVEESNIVSVYEKIIAEIAFDEYVNPKESTYNEAIGLMSAEKYDEAILIFTELGGYKDSAEMIAQCQIAIRDNMLENAKQLIEKGNYYDAIDVLEKLGEHGDSKEQLKIAQYGYANSLFNDGKYNDAAKIFKGLGNYENSIELFNQSQYAYALSLMNSQSYDAAIALFDELSNYAPAKEKSNECKYILAIHCIDTFDYDGAKGYLNQILDYKDAAKYMALLDNIVSDIYYNDEYSSMSFIWVVSRINTSNCSSELIIYTGQDNAPWDDEYVVDFSRGIWYEWKKTNSQYYMTSTGAQDDSYYVITLNGQSLTEQFHSSDGSNKVTDTYHILSDEHSGSLKENWIQYFEDDEYGYWEYDEWVYAEATVK